MPAVTVLMPAHNAAATLDATLESLAVQTMRDFKVLLVNDASHDNTADIALRYSSRMEVEVLNLTENHGVAGALNRGLLANQSPYIARLDADDLAVPTRLEKQFAFLEANPDIAVCSSWMQMFYEDGRPPDMLVKPQHDATIKTALIQYCSMSHGASMFRKSFFDDVGEYNTRLDFAEDYDLWIRGALLGKRYANIQEALSLYRRHENRVGVQKRQLQYERDLAIKHKYLTALLDGASPGHLPEFFSLLTSFSTREVALNVLQQSMPQLLKLGRRLEDQTAFAEIVAGCIGRHLGE